MKLSSFGSCLKRTLLYLHSGQVGSPDYDALGAAADVCDAVYLVTGADREVGVAVVDWKQKDSCTVFDDRGISLGIYTVSIIIKHGHGKHQ